MLLRGGRQLWNSTAVCNRQPTEHAASGDFDPHLFNVQGRSFLVLPTLHDFGTVRRLHLSRGVRADGAQDDGAVLVPCSHQRFCASCAARVEEEARGWLPSLSHSNQHGAASLFGYIRVDVLVNFDATLYF